MTSDISKTPAGAARVKSFVGVAIVMLATIALVQLWNLPEGTAPAWDRALNELAWWGLAAFALFWAMRVEGQSLAALDIKRPGFGSFGWGLLVAVGLIFLFGLVYSVLFPALGISSHSKQLQNIATHESVPMILLLTIRAGVVEEWLFRFFAIGRLQSALHNKWLASLIPGIIFVALHAKSWGLAHLIPVTIAATVLTLVYWWRRDFWTSAFAHFLTDFIPFAGTALYAAHHAAG